MKWIVTAGIVGLATVSVVLTGCQDQGGGARSEAYIENGEVWAYGSVQLTNLPMAGEMIVRRQASEQSVEGEERLELIGKASDAQAEVIRDLAYVDYHPHSIRVLAYAYQPEFSRSSQDPEIVHVYGRLKKAGASYFRRYRVYLGNARLPADANEALVNRGDGLKLSAIATGVFSGQWAMHYANINRVKIRPYQGICRDVVSQRPGQAPGQTPGQNPSQTFNCQPLPPKADLCNGDPTQKDCRPARPAQVRATPDATQPVPTPELNNDRELTAEPQQVAAGDVFVMPAGLTNARLIFVSEKTLATDATGEACGRGFLAVARSVGRQVNSACRLVPAPAEPVDGKLACALTVEFVNARTYMERVCNISTVFRSADGIESQQVQVLRGASR